MIPVNAQNRSQWERRPAQIHSADERGALTFPSTASPDAVVAQFLMAHGHDAATARSIASGATRSGIASQAASGAQISDDGLIHIRADQQVNGLTVYGSYVKAALNPQGQIVHLIENLAPVTSNVVAASIDEERALSIALGRVHPGVASPRTANREEGKTVFARGGYFYAAPTVTRVLASMPDGSLRESFLVETWTRQKNVLNHTLVSGDGDVLDVELRTANDQYFVYIEDPGKEAAQTLVSGPAPVTPPGTAPSPSGWLGTGSQKTINITGNNVHAYLDASPANNQPDSGGSTVSNGAFTTVHSRTTAPSTTGNRAVAVQNLFYLNNRIHDTLYVAGFNESEANFQENNFSRGGSGSDSVNAEAQDGGGLDNANFATPNEGQNPRMQMYLFTGKPSHQVVVGSSLYDAAGAEFGPALTSTGKTGAISLTSPADGCTAISTTLTGKIAILDRGTCSFIVKVKNAQLKGAIGVIVANNAGDSVIAMGGTDTSITIPSVFVGQTSGNAIKAAAGTNATIRITTPAPLQRDGDLDADIVFHEYGHGLTWRMIGSMSGPMAGAIGEGMGDVLALVMNGDDRMGEYAASDPLGIRSAPYANFPRTYGSVTGSEVHFDGEIYGAIGWRLLELYTSAGLTNTDLLRDLVQGMRFTPAQPNYQQMRDGILTATTTNDCKVWTAFAQYGVGQGATSTVNNQTGVITVTESFTIPAGVCP